MYSIIICIFFPSLTAQRVASGKSKEGAACRADRVLKAKLEDGALSAVA